MANNERVYIDTKESGIAANLKSRGIRLADAYYYDFVAGGNTFVSSDSGDTQAAMTALGASPLDTIYRTAEFDIESWDDGDYIFPVHKSGLLAGFSMLYIKDGMVMNDEHLSTKVESLKRLLRLKKIGG